jgi:hypothetical protein
MKTVEWLEVAVIDNFAEFLLSELLMNCIIWEGNLVIFKAEGHNFKRLKSGWLHEKYKAVTWNVLEDRRTAKRSGLRAFRMQGPTNKLRGFPQVRAAAFLIT